MTTPTTETLHVLMIEDSPTDAKLIVRELRNTGYAIEWERVDSATAMREALGRATWDLIICDWSMPRFSALAALGIAGELGIDMPFLIVSGTVGEEWAVEAMRMGAHDYVLKDKLARLAPAVERELRERRSREARGKAEYALRTTQTRYRHMVETANEGVWTIDATAHTTFMNARMAQLLGYEAGEVIGKSLFDFVDERGVAALARHVSRHHEGLAGRIEARFKRKDGTTVWVLIESSPICDESGRYDGALAMVTDLTERKEAEAALRASEAQLRQAAKMEAIGNLAGGIAHDFNNLLSVILSYSTMLAECLKPEDPMRADLDAIRAAGERAAQLTRQLLAFSRRQILQPRLVNLNEVVTQTEQMLRRLIGEDVELTVLRAPEVGAIKVDPGQIEQVILNLAVNARDAMPQGGKLTIETANVTLDQAYAAEHVGVTPGPHVLLAISDTGTGMDQATQAHMFEPFFTTKEPGKGTGLGLATVFGIVKQSGGSIWVYSEPGQGTTFKLYFPLADASAADESPAGDAPKAVTLSGTETILLVEDDDRVRELALTLLRRYGYHVMEARNGGEALLISEQHSATIHLLLTDVVMPRMSGPQLTERLRTTRPDMRILYMSGYTDNSIVHHGMLDSDVEFLQKPITPDALAKKVRRVLDAPRRTSGGDQLR